MFKIEEDIILMKVTITKKEMPVDEYPRIEQYGSFASYREFRNGVRSIGITAPYIIDDTELGGLHDFS